MVTCCDLCQLLPVLRVAHPWFHSLKSKYKTLKWRALSTTLPYKVVLTRHWFFSISWTMIPNVFFSSIFENKTTSFTSGVIENLFSLLSFQTLGFWYLTAEDWRYWIMVFWRCSLPLDLALPSWEMMSEGWNTSLNISWAYWFISWGVTQGWVIFLGVRTG